jgi:hypothetical protein
LSAAVSVLVRRRLPVGVLVPAVLTIAGWTSNLLDRLGLHYWTAPGSVRGAVDFLHWGHHYYNVADLFIIVGTPWSLVGIALLARRAMTTARSRPAAPSRQYTRRTSTRMSALVGALAVIVVVGLGAVHYGVVSDSLASAGASRNP